MSGIDESQLRTKLIRPILQKYNLWSQAAENLLIGTVAQESSGGKWLVQFPNGPALGIFQMEPATYHDIRSIVIPNPKIQLDFDIPVTPENMIWDLRLATIMCRLHYWRFKEPLPEADDIPGLSKYYKKYYNTSFGKANSTDFVLNYYTYCS
jgi:hypothetical protein